MVEPKRCDEIVNFRNARADYTRGAEGYSSFLSSENFLWGIFFSVAVLRWEEGDNPLLLDSADYGSQPFRTARARA